MPVRKRTAGDAQTDFESSITETIERQIDSRLDGLIQAIHALTGEVRELKVSISSLVDAAMTQNETAKMQAENVSRLLNILDRVMPRQDVIAPQ